MLETPTQFLIYRASAGSGKTFSLTYEYFKIIFNPQNTLDEYRHILAVTFTNKATEEMKSRIINQLHVLAEGQKSDYGRLLKEEFQFSDDDLKRRAVQLRSALLHDYGRISVTTIDRFFQRIIKSFTKELGIFPSYNVELDESLVLNNAIETMLANISENKDLCLWLNELISNKIEDSKSWNIKTQMENIGYELFKENYRQSDKQNLEIYKDKDFLRVFRQELIQIRQNYVTKLTDLAQQIMRIVDGSGLIVKDFKINVLDNVEKMAKGNVEEVKITATMRSVVDNEDGWYAKKRKENEIKAVYPRLNPLYKSIIQFYDTEYKKYNTAVFICQNLYLIGVLNDLYRQIRDDCHAKGVLLISDTTEILNKLIANNDTSFLFEKTGNYYHHIMIDEFQDTSTMQWRNFKPLIVNSLSAGNISLIVGDIKQSIYRWRNGDWTLLAHGVARDLAHFNPQQKTLQKNWRSGRKIVEFNNALFKGAAFFLAEKIRSEIAEAELGVAQILSAYADVVQDANSKLSGYVDVRMIEENEEETLIMNDVIEIVEDYRARGGRFQDVTILVRDKKEGQKVVDALMAYNEKNEQKIDFISNDSLLLWTSPYIRFIISVLKYMAEPFDEINRAAMLHLYHIQIKSDESLWEENDIAQFDNFIQGLKSNSLYEIVEAMIAHFGIHKTQSEMPYLLVFQDIVFKYESDNSNNIPLFLEWWTEKQDGQLLTTSEQVDAVRILTIHKSKGLEFECVILPFCDWELDSIRPIRRIWCSSSVEPFKKVGSVPIDYSSKLKDSCFSNDYDEEHLKAYVDNLNLLYVALTRASRELYIRPQVKSGKEVKNVSQVLGVLLPTLEMDEKEEGWYCMGEKNAVESKVVKQVDAISVPEYPVYELGDRVSVKYRYREFLETEKEEHTAIDEGKLLHAVFQYIQTEDDIEKAVREVYMQGMMSVGEQETYVCKVRDFMRNSQVKEWFSGRYQVVNERDILLHTTDCKLTKVRPDRVLVDKKKVLVVDYKFGKESSAYSKQVAFYCRVLQKMGYDTEGFIWYVTLDKIEKV